MGTPSALVRTTARKIRRVMHHLTTRKLPRLAFFRQQQQQQKHQQRQPSNLLLCEPPTMKTLRTPTTPTTAPLRRNGPPRCTAYNNVTRQELIPKTNLRKAYSNARND